jgi:hypothetical protein
MTSRCLSAGGLRFLDRPVPAAEFRRSCDWPTTQGGPQRDCHVPHRGETHGVGVLFTPGSWYPHRSKVGSPGLDPNLLSWLPIGPAISLDGASTRIHVCSPVRACPSPGWPDGSASPWALPLASHPAVTGDARRDWAQAADTCLGRGLLLFHSFCTTSCRAHSQGLYPPSESLYSPNQ